MASELGFSMKDLYPNYLGVDTSTIVTPEPNDQDALNEDTKVVREAVNKQARSKNIFLALAVLVGLIIFFGGK